MLSPGNDSPASNSATPRTQTFSPATKKRSSGVLAKLQQLQIAQETYRRHQSKIDGLQTGQETTQTDGQNRAAMSHLSRSRQKGSKTPDNMRKQSNHHSRALSPRTSYNLKR